MQKSYQIASHPFGLAISKRVSYYIFMVQVYYDQIFFVPLKLPGFLY
jgi:hypothetical protein